MPGIDQDLARRPTATDYAEVLFPAIEEAGARGWGLPRGLLARELPRSPLAVTFLLATLSGSPSRAAPPAAAASPTIEALRAACDGKEPRSCRQLGQRTLRTPDLTPERRREAVSLFRRACDGGDLDGCAELGWSLATGLGGAPDPVRSRSTLKSACDRGSLDGCSKLGVLVQNGVGGGADAKAAAELYQKACDGGNADGCDRLGILYNTGLGVKKDEARGVALQQKACEAGSGVGCNDLGSRYANGSGVPRDEQRACELFRQACESGVSYGCSDLAFMYVNGRGVPQDLAEATRYAEMACGLGGAFGCAKLGLLRLRSSDRKVREKGIELLRRTCAREDGLVPLSASKQGIAEACAFLAEAYETGDGVDVDKRAAIGFMRRACELHYPGACERAKEIESDRTACMAECQRLAKEGALREGVTSDSCIRSTCQ